MEETVGRTEVDAEVEVRGARRTVMAGREEPDAGMTETAPAMVEMIWLLNKEVPGPAV
jgi:hypothetical protein